jgi:hypothetical protein
LPWKEYTLDLTCVTTRRNSIPARSTPTSFTSASRATPASSNAAAPKPAARSSLALPPRHASATPTSGAARVAAAALAPAASGEAGDGRDTGAGGLQSGAGVSGSPPPGAQVGALARRAGVAPAGGGPGLPPRGWGGGWRKSSAAEKPASFKSRSGNLEWAEETTEHGGNGTRRHTYTRILVQMLCTAITKIGSCCASPGGPTSGGRQPCRSQLPAAPPSRA